MYFSLQFDFALKHTLFFSNNVLRLALRRSKNFLLIFCDPSVTHLFSIVSQEFYFLFYFILFYFIYYIFIFIIIIYLFLRLNA